jgi:hypothetical protein
MPSRCQIQLGASAQRLSKTFLNDLERLSKARRRIELTNRVTETTGLVTDDRGEPVKDYAVVIFARDRQKWGAPSRWIRTARSDQDGRFKIGGDQVSFLL